MPDEKRFSCLSELPGPRGLPFIGNLLQLDLRRQHLILEEWARRYGTIYRFKLFNKTVVVLGEARHIQDILRDRPQSFRRVSSIERVSRELGTHGVFSAEGAEWQQQRARVMQAFRTENLRHFFPELRTITERLQSRWSAMADAGRDVEARKEWMKFTVDVTTRFAFGYDINLLEKENDDFQRHLEHQLPAFNRRANAPFPYWHYIKLPGDRKMEKSLAAIKETINDFIEQARLRLARQTGTERPSSFLEALLLARTEDGEPLPDEEILGNVMTILIAGEDTTAHTLSWLLYLIGKHPDVQFRMQQEADAALGGSFLPPNIDAIDNMPYLEAVILETLRLKSTAPMLFLEPVREAELAGISIPKGTMLVLLTRFCALQEENFGDAHQFRPERWLEPRPSVNHNRSAFIPFGAGPRFCPGRQLAMLEMKSAMAMVARNFTVVQAKTEQSVEEVFSFTMMPEPLAVRFRVRQHR